MKKKKMETYIHNIYIVHIKLFTINVIGDTGVLSI